MTSKIEIVPVVKCSIATSLKTYWTTDMKVCWRCPCRVYTYDADRSLVHVYLNLRRHVP